MAKLASENSTSFKGYIKRAHLCTSPLQVINARSSMDYNQQKGKEYKDSLIIIHPALSRRSKELISEIGNRLDYDELYDFTAEFENIMNLVRSYCLKNLVSFHNRRETAEKNREIAKIVRKIKEKLYSDHQIYDELYCRNILSIDSLAIETSVYTKKLFCVPEGLGSYQKKSWGKKKRQTEDMVLNMLAYFLKLLKGYNHKFIKFLLPIRYKYSEVFSTLEYADNISVKNYFIKNLKKLSDIERCDPSKKVVIIGSLLGDANKMKISISQEVELYNSIIRKIKNLHKVSNKEIWYKPHPRCTFEGWKYKRENLRCQTYDFDSNPIFELEMISPYLKAVYSIGSNALLLAKSLFNLDAFLIDLRNYNIHPFAFDTYYDVCTRYGVEVIEV